MSIIVTAGQIHCTTVQAEFESAEITPKTALKKSRTLSVKEQKIVNRIGCGFTMKIKFQ